MNATELRAKRQGKKMTQAQLAAWLGVSRPTVTAWEQVTNPVPKWVAEKLSERPTLNPKLDYATFAKAQEKANEAGKSLEDWIADLIRSALGVGAFWTIVHLF
jgi:DNA-binding XRE family transcriptional regulator